MALKPGAKDCVIKEQIISPPSIGLTLKFSACPEDSAYGCIITAHGDNLPYGDTDLYFHKDGKYDGSCTSTSESCKPSWLKEVSSKP